MKRSKIREWGISPRTLCAFAAALTLISDGCTGKGPARVPVRGTVTLDGRPLEQGTILFSPTTANVRPDQVMIQADGAFEISIIPGDYRVVVSSYNNLNPPGVMAGDPGYREPKSLVPTKYSSLSRTPFQFVVDHQNSVVDLTLNSR